MTDTIARHWWQRPGWDEGTRFYTVHATFAEDPLVQGLMEQARARLAAVPWLDLVPGRWLHLTMQGIGFAAEISEDAVAAIGAGAARHLAAVPPAAVTIGPPVPAGEGVTCWAAPPRALNPARDAVRAAIAEALGPGALTETEDWSAHVSAAYASADGPAAEVEKALDGLDATASTVIGVVDLIRLGRDGHLYTWDTIARLPLGG